MEYKFIELQQKHVDNMISWLPKDVIISIVFMDLPRYASTIVRAAIAAKWFESPPVGDIGEMKPSDVMQIAIKVREAYNKSLEVSPE